jgi:hypothetical protein
MSEHPINLTPAPQPTWETLTFPHAMSVEEIADHGHDLPVQPSLVSGDSFLKVQQDNQELRDQVAALDAALLRSQYALRAEMERWEALALAKPDPAESSETRLHNQNQELSGSQVRLGQLFVELEQSHRMAQRQQILVETLTEQLQSSHEQIAQLERDCANVQARSSEQAQGLLQSEHTCRDLRSRLQRQQRYTLQFKAALEKCLDVPTATAQGVVADLLPDTSAPTPEAAPVKLNIPRSQPVQPWSSTIEADVTASPVGLQTWANALVTQTPPEHRATEPEDTIGEPLTRRAAIAETSPEADHDALAETVNPTSVNPTSVNPTSVNPTSVNPASVNPASFESIYEPARLDTWEAVLAQVHAIVGEDAKIVEATEPEPVSEEEAAIENESIEQDPILNKIRDIAPVINPGRSIGKKLDSLASVELPSFGRRV